MMQGDSTAFMRATASASGGRQRRGSRARALAGFRLRPVPRRRGLHHGAGPEARASVADARGRRGSRSQVRSTKSRQTSVTRPVQRKSLFWGASVALDAAAVEALARCGWAPVAPVALAERLTISRMMVDLRLRSLRYLDRRPARFGGRSLFAVASIVIFAMSAILSLRLPARPARTRGR